MKIEQQKEKYLKKLRLVNREGTEELINWLEESTDFFTAPASSYADYHECYRGGLLKHTNDVITICEKKGPWFASYLWDIRSQWLVENYISVEAFVNSLILCAAVHDLCKVNQYIPEKNKWWRENKGRLYTVDNKTHLPHGTRSLFYAMQAGLELTKLEASAITFHMGPFDIPDSADSKGNFYNSFKTPLTKLLHTADCESILLEGS